MTDQNPSQARTRGLKSSSKSVPSQEGSKTIWWKTKIATLEARVAELESEVQSDGTIRAQLDAKDRAIKAIEGIDGGDMGPLPINAWGLVLAEYFHRTKKYQFVSDESRRTIGDANGNSWSLKPLPNLNGLSDEHVEMYTALAEAFGYDAYAPPKDDYILLHCLPRKGAYDIATQELEKAQETHRRARKAAWAAAAQINSARATGAQNLLEQHQKDLDYHEQVAKEAAQAYQERKAIIDNAVQRFYLIPMESLERMDHYGMRVQCQTATVLPQKRHRELGTYDPPQEAVTI